MAQQFPFENDTPTNVVLLVETVAQTTNGVSTPSAGQPIWIDGQIDFTPGAAATAVTVRIRRGAGIAGTAVGDAEVPIVVAGNRILLPYSIKDSPGDVANQQYSITVQQTAATGNGTINSVSGNVAVGSP